MTIGEACHELNNYFDRNLPKFHGAFEISGGKIVDSDFVAEIQDNQYFRIIGSVFNDGVYKNNESLALIDEVFVGNVWFMAVPKEFEDIVAEMTQWESDHGTESMSPFQSESFGGYSYSKGSKSNGTGSTAAVTAFDMFASRINKWRKLR